MKKLKSANAPLLVYLLFIMCNDVHIFVKNWNNARLDIQIFSVEKKHDGTHDTKNKAVNKKQINSSLLNKPFSSDTLTCSRHSKSKL